MNEQKKVFKKIMVGVVVILFLVVGLSPISYAKTAEKEQANNILDIFSQKLNGNKALFLEENDFDFFKEKISEIINTINQEKGSEDAIIKTLSSVDEPSGGSILSLFFDFFSNLQGDNGNGLLAKKTLVISQGWSHDFNYLKNSKFEMKRSMYSFWRFSQGSKNGLESKTVVLRPGGLLGSRSAEMYKGKQTVFMYRPTGLYIYQKNKFPMPSYTLFIGYASSVGAHAEEEILLNYPLT